MQYLSVPQNSLAWFRHSHALSSSDLPPRKGRLLAERVPVWEAGFVQGLPAGGGHRWRNHVLGRGMGPAERFVMFVGAWLPFSITASLLGCYLLFFFTPNWEERHSELVGLVKVRLSLAALIHAVLCKSALAQASTEIKMTHSLFLTFANF